MSAEPDTRQPLHEPPAHAEPRAGAVGASPRRRRWLRRLLIGGGAVLVALLVLVALIPTIAGWIAPGYIERAVAGSINGTAHVQQANFSWFGHQRVGPVVIRDPTGGEVIRASVDVSRPLTGLVSGAIGVGSLDTGEVRVRASADVVREADGTINVRRLLKDQPEPAPRPAPAEPTRLPPSFAARIVIEDLDLVFEDRAPGGDPAARIVRLQDATGEGVLAVGQPLTFTLRGQAQYAPDLQAAGTPAGEVRIDATAQDWSDATGLVTMDQARFTATLEATNLSVEPADALARMNGALVESLGDRVNLTIKASGTTRDAVAEVNAQATGLDAELALRYVTDAKGPRLVAQEPGTIRVQSGALRALVPGFKQALDQQQVATVTTWPETTLSINDLNVALPRDDGSIDLRGSSLSLQVQTGAMSGEVVTPGPEGAAGQRQPFALAPFDFSVESRDLAGPVRVRGNGGATIGEQPAGSLVVDLSASGLLDAQGAPVGMPRVLRGTMLLKGVSTALAQPLVAAAGLDLPRDIGPTLDVDLRASAQGARAAADQGGAAGAAEEGARGIPTTDVDLTIRSARLQTLAALQIDERGVRGRGAEGEPAIELTLASAASIASRLAEQAGAARITGGGPLTVRVTGLDVPFTQDGTDAALDRAAGRVDLSLGNLNVLPLTTGPDGAPVPPAGAQALQVRSLQATAALSPGTAPGVALDAQLAHGDRPFALTGNFALENLLTVPATGGEARPTPGAMRPVGTLRLQDAPTSLARLVPGLAATAPADGGPDGQAGLDVARLIADSVGPALSVSVETSVARARADRLNIAARVDSAGLNGAFNGGLVPEAIVLDRGDLRATVSPPLAQTLLATFAPTLDPRPTLAAPGVMTVEFDPLRIPLAEGGGLTPDFARAGDVTARVGLEGPLTLENVRVRNADGTVRDVGAVHVESMRIMVAAPLRAVAQAGGVGTARLAANARLLSGTPPAPLATIDATGEAELSGGAPVGALTANVKLTDADTRVLDRFMETPGLLETALGPRFSVDASAEAPSSAAERLSLTGSITAPALTTARPFQATITPERIGLDAPMVLNWTMSPEFGNTQLLGLPAGGPGAGAAAPPQRPPDSPARAPPGPAGAQEPPATGARFTEPTNFTITVNRLALGRGLTPLKPGVFALGADVQAPSIGLATADGTARRFGALTMRLGEQRQQGSIGYSLRVNAAGQGGPDAPVDISGGVHGISDAQGHATLDKGVLNARIAAREIPSALVDTLAAQGGLLAETLGPTVTVEGQVVGYPLGPGDTDRGAVNATLTAPRATAGVKGLIRDGAFVAQEPLKAQITIVTPELGSILAKGVPQVATFQKTREDGPAAFTATGVTLPLDGDLRKLNGDVVFDLGQVRFQTSGRFRGILKVLEQRQEGWIGSKVQPFKAQFRSGVMTYERYRLPLGEFNLDSVGQVDFVNNTLDITMFIPLGALTDEAAGLFNTNLGRLLGDLPVIGPTTMVPWRVQGNMDSPKVEPDVEAYIKNLGRELNPLNMIKDIGDRLKPKDKGGAGTGGGGGGGGGGGRR